MNNSPVLDWLIARLSSAEPNNSNQHLAGLCPAFFFARRVHQLNNVSLSVKMAYKFTVKI
jgi:hypothetical protein